MLALYVARVAVLLMRSVAARAAYADSFRSMDIRAQNGRSKWTVTFRVRFVGCGHGPDEDAWLPFAETNPLALSALDKYLGDSEHFPELGLA